MVQLILLAVDLAAETIGRLLSEPVLVVTE